MSEPTIDELIEALDGLVEMAEGELGKGPPEEDRNYNAIRAILERHRETEEVPLVTDAVRKLRLKAIRAFVERVEQRLPDYDTGRGADSMLKAYRQAVYDELAALEKETE
jgi:hypothetical protein